jgi:hypothetical protein
VVASLHDMGAPAAGGFRIGYAGNAMPVRLAVESKDWATAARLEPLPGSTPQVAAIVWWARALGRLRAATPSALDGDGECRRCYARNDSHHAEYAGRCSARTGFAISPREGRPSFRHKGELSPADVLHCEATK